MPEEEPPEKIQDIPSYRVLAKSAEGVEALTRLWPLLQSFGIVGKVPVDSGAIAELKEKTQELLGLPDRFNAAFSSRGWIAYETLNVDLMKRAAALAESGALEAGEAEILAYYRSEESIRWHLQTMRAVRAWRPREDLANLAMADYLAGRFHASIPVVLALLDGLVSDLATTGFFAEGTEMTVWDSVAGHSSGLQAICDIFNKGRRKTTQEQILVPYRHGIIHGRDLGYANEAVAAKVWAVLFAVREWALKIEGGEVGKREETKEPTFLESLQGLVDVQRNREELDRWEARTSGDQASMEAGSPEQRAVEILEYWSKGNYGGIAGCLSALSGNESIGKRAGRVRQNLAPKKIDSFQILAVADEAPAISVVIATVRKTLEGDAALEEQCFGLRMIFEGPNGKSLLRGKPEGTWKVIEWTLYTPKKQEDLLSGSRVVRLAET